jgi:dihydrofolate reductase
MASNRVIGRDGDMPWHLPADLHHFKRTTLGKPLIMGRKTFASIGRPLPGRTNIIITRNPDFHAEGITVAADFDDALRCAARIAKADGVDEIMVGGGGEIYRRALPHATRIYLTKIGRAIDGDTVFPELDPAQWRESQRDAHPATDSAPPYSFVVLDRIG